MTMVRVRRNLITWTLLLAAFFPAALLAATAAEEKKQEGKVEINWVKGPAKAELGDMAEIQIPEGFLFAGQKDTAVLMELMGNLPHEGRLGLIGPESFLQGGPNSWFVVFEFDDSGYVKDDEKENLDADGLLKSMIEGSQKSNEVRLKQGLGSLLIQDWAVPPHYDDKTNNLEWGLLLESKEEGQEPSKVVNYEVRLLGRKGVMESTLVLGPEGLESAMNPFRGMLTGFSFKEGNKYSEFRQGDKLAQYGLTALIGGGAVALAAKSGLLKYLWKFLVVGAVAVSALFKKLTGKKKEDPPASV